MIKKVIFTDLDGTLLDNNYKFSGARRALEYLEELEIPLIICTSKTKAEIEVYRKKLGNNHPFISENGGGVFIPVNYFSNENKKLLTRYQTVNLGTPYKQLVAMLNKIRKKVNVRGFSDMSANEISEDTGLNLRQAKLAKKRDYDEAFKLLNKKDEEKLIRLIRKYGLDYTKGGRYYHITGGNNKGKAVKVLLGFYKKKYGKVFSMSLGDAANDYPMFKATDKGILIKEGPKEWNKKVISILKLDQKYVRDSEELYLNSIKVLKKFQLSNGAVLASSPKGRYPYVYPRDHSICILGLIDSGEMKRARKALKFILKTQNTDGSYPQRLDRNGRDSSYKPIQLDNTGLVLYAFSKYIRVSRDEKILDKYKDHIKNSIKYIESKFDKKKKLFFTPNSIHEFPPIEKGLEIWANSVCYGALKELEEIGFKSRLELEKIKKSIEKYFWNSRYFIKNIRLKESSSAVSYVDASSYALEEFGVFDYDNEKIIKNIEKIENELWHKKLGGLCRYPKFVGRNNGGWGPWPHFTLMVCRHYIRMNNKKKADKYLNWILKFKSDNLLPEHIATKKDFEEWVNEYEKAGLIRKDRKVMIKNIRKSKMYDRGLAYSVLPLTWPHSEFIITWNLYKEKFLE